jgi:hypothetical protein
MRDILPGKKIALQLPLARPVGGINRTTGEGYIDSFTSRSNHDSISVIYLCLFKIAQFVNTP